MTPQNTISLKENLTIFKQIRQRWLLKKTTVFLVNAMAVGLLIGLISQVYQQFSTFPQNYYYWAVVAALLSIAIQYYRHPIFRLKNEDIATYLNQQFPSLEHSATLLLREKNDLRLLEQLQQEQTIDKLKVLQQKKAKNLFMPVALLRPVFGLLLSGSVFLLGSSFLEQVESGSSIFEQESAKTLNNVSTDSQVGETIVPFQVQATNILIEPPQYTQKTSERFQKLQSLSVLEGSEVIWEIKGNQALKQAVLYLGEKDSLVCESKGQNTYQVKTTFTDNNLYYFRFYPYNQAVITTDFYKISVQKDLPPKVLIDTPEQYTELDITLKKDQKLQIDASIGDDYGIQQAKLLLTITRGEGESVKFREEEVTFDRRKRKNANEEQFSKQLNLLDLKIEPGDELYFYVLASDNKQPKANQTKSDVYFVNILDTVEQATFDMSGVAVNLMPAYFRSQRQIIIDTEKLIAEQASIDPEKFQNKSNVLGDDQKILRLRYGKFLGEEYESHSGGGEEDHEGHDHADHEGHDHADHEGHDHADHEGHDHADSTLRGNDSHDALAPTVEMIDHAEHDHETALADDNHAEGSTAEMKESNKKPKKEGEHNHSHGEDDGGVNMKEENKIGTSKRVADQIDVEYMHIHDIDEAATFFPKAIKAKLKAAMSIMWDAELHLRMGEPQLALPYEYKALKLIKEVQQDSRIYVHKVGFDPPPLKPLKSRLKGELEDIEDILNQDKIDLKKAFPNTKAALELLQMVKKTGALQNADIATLQSAGRELSQATVQQKGNYLNALQHLRKLINTYQQDGTICSFCLRAFEAGLWQLLPQHKAIQPQQQVASKRTNQLYYQFLYD